MRRSLCLTLTMLVSACGSDGGPEDPDSGASHDAPVLDASPADANQLVIDRPYGLLVPAGYDGSQPVPLVLLLHGYGANGNVQAAYFGLNALAESEGFLLAYPDGTVDSGGRAFWNATDACCDFDGTGVDDVAYLTAVLDDVQGQYNVDPKRVYAVGHSNGGFMSYRLACDITPRLAAIVSLAGATWLDPGMCNPTGTISVLQVHGDMDTTVPYDGAAGYPSATGTVAQWATKNGCSGPLEVAAKRLDIDDGLAGDETMIARHSGCPAGAAAELWTIVGGGHIPNLSPNWATSIYAFLSAHPRP